MTGVDEQVGRIIRQLKEQGLFENTIVVFTSDLRQHGGCTSISDKNIYYEEAMRIPMMISWPEKDRAAPGFDPDDRFRRSVSFPLIINGIQRTDTSRGTDLRSVCFHPLTGKGTGGRTALLLSSP